MNRNYTHYSGSEIVEQGKYEVTWEQVRKERDILLAQTDWRAVKDRTMSQGWKDYRTALRDLPQNHSESNDAADNFPEAPDE